MAAHSAALAPDTWLIDTLTAAAVWLLVIPALGYGRAAGWLLGHQHTPAVVQAAAVLAGTIAATALTVDVPWLSVVIAFGGIFGQALFHCWRWADPS